jgi:crossover junction endodeoxyribonuclease RusA
VPSLPWDFTVIGTPASVQASSATRSRWKGEVATAARARWPAGDPPLLDKLGIHVTCFHDSAPPLDADNMLKPIQDALIGIAYADDNQLTDTHGHLRDLNRAYEVRRMSPELARGFVSGEPFVNIRIEAAPATSRLP